MEAVPGAAADAWLKARNPKFEILTGEMSDVKTTTDETMSKPFLVRHQDELLRRYRCTAPGLISVQCVRATEALLRRAGVAEPVAFDFYAVRAKVIYGGTKLVLACDPADGVPVMPSEEVDEVPVYDEFGPISGDDRTNGADADGPATAEDFAELRRVTEELKAVEKKRLPGRGWLQARELPGTVVARVFEVPVREGMKARVTVEMFEDDSLPVPLELPRWRGCTRVEDIEVWAATRALSEARCVTDFEISPGGSACADVPASGPSAALPFDSERLVDVRSEQARGPGVMGGLH